MNLVNAAGTVHVAAGTYIEDVNVDKALTLHRRRRGLDDDQRRRSAAAARPFSGLGAGVVIAGFTITRDGNNTTDWNNPGLNTAGVAVQGLAIAGVEVREQPSSPATAPAIDINNSNGNTIHNNVDRRQPHRA